MSFRAFRIHQEGHGVRAGFEEMEIDDLTPGEVVVRVCYSGINYKDALAATGKGRILRIPSVNGGVDLAGEVMSSTSDRFHPGDRVVACSYGLSETVDGGYAQYARLDADCLIPLPDGLTDRDVMVIGTAGYTAALALIRMEANGQSPRYGPIVVTGATGGVGSFAINLFSKMGYEVVALTGKREAYEYLRTLGASHCLDRESIDMGVRPLENAQWGGAVDNVGGEILAWLIRRIRKWGNVASIGLAGGAEFEITVMPFILRGVSLLGINCNVSMEMRATAWRRLASDLKPSNLERIESRTIPFSELPRAFDAYINGTVTGRTVVKIGD